MDAMRELDFPAPMRKELRIQLEAYRDLQQKHAAAKAEAAAQSRERAKAARAAASAASDAPPTEMATTGAATDTMDVDQGDMPDASHIDETSSAPIPVQPNSMET